MSYWDASALVKLFVTESDSGAFRALAASTNQLVSGTVGELEVRTYLRRRGAEGLLAAGGSRALNSDLQDDIACGRLRIRLFDDAVDNEFSNVLEKCFSQQPPIFVRTNDALHIASAIVDGSTEFVTADGRQRAAAVLMGLTVLP